jgi:hypothetical protein
MSASYEQLKADFEKLVVEIIAAEIRGMERAAQMAKKIWYETDDFDRAIQVEIDELKKIKDER